MIGLLACHFLAAAILPWLPAWLRRRVFLLGGLPLAATLVWSFAHGAAILAGRDVVESLPWAPDLGLDLVVRVDAFSLLMIALVSGIGILIFAYSQWYFDDEPAVTRLAALLVGFAGSMLGLVVADNLIALFLFWELTSITSYFLIGFEDRSAPARAAALRALLVTNAGGLAMLAGFVLLAHGSQTYVLSEILRTPPTGHLADAAIVLVLVGAFTKSAQVPFHFWLPGAMAAPTPVSAYLHSATMVKAGVYLVARLAPAFADVWFWRPLLLAVGLLTMLVGGWRALAQRDLKLLLAHGTTSQLGLMMMLVGAGYEQATLAGAALLLAHGAFKAALFMVVGIVDHAAGTRDLTRLHGWYPPLRTTFWVAALAGASMAGLPPLAGFIAKEAAFEAFLPSTARSPDWLVLLVLVAGSALTVAYTARFIWGAFAPKTRAELQIDRVVEAVSPPAWPLLAPAGMLALASLVLGIFPGRMSELVVAGARALDHRVPSDPLALWHGFNAALALSAAALAGGTLLWGLRHGIGLLQRRLHWPIDAARAHDRAVNLLLHGADAVTGRVQTGSLPMYLAVIMATATIGPGIFLAMPANIAEPIRLADRPMQIVVALLMIAATAIAVNTPLRMVAVVSVSVVGYGIAFLFVIQGAPDLALTQLLVETLLLVLFVLVLRHLPPMFSTRGAMWKVTRIAVALAVGLFTAAAALVATAARTTASISTEYLARALPEAHGRNVVNVILVDFRAFDTFGEILVLAIAALGVTGLVRAAGRDRRRAEKAEPGDHRYRASTILDGAVRMLFHTVALISLVFLVVGHDRPGGGFIGGLVAGTAFVLIYLAGGTSRLRRAPAVPEWYLGGGITLAAATGALSWLGGREFLEALVLSVELPVLGTITLASVLLFDLGVYLVVIGLVLALLRALGRETVRA